LNDPFLIDECLSLDLVALAHARGHHATHVGFRSLLGTLDRALMPVIRAEGFVLVTNNGRDFLKLFRHEPVHPGLIVIVPGSIRAAAQVRLFGLALDVIEPLPDLVNKLVQVSIDGTVELKDWPPA
jgi:predicted nuclease of predicted toxin-antitoxin system